MKLFKHRLIVKLVASVIITTFLWSNLIYASGSLTTNYLAIDGGKMLNGVFTEFKVLSTPLAIHNGVTTKGIVGLRGLTDELEGIKKRLVQAGIIPQEEADKYLAMQFDDPVTKVPSYYYFNKDGYFLRITSAEEVNDRFYIDFLRLKGRREGDIVSINGNYLEKFLISKDDIKGINICLKRLYGYTLYDAEMWTEDLKRFMPKQNPASSLAGKVKDRYEKLISQKQSTVLSIVYDYTSGKEKEYRLRVPKEKDLTNDEKAFVVVYLAVYIYNRLTTIGAGKLRLITEDKQSIIGILEEIENIFMHGKSIYSAQYPILNDLWLMTVGSKIIDGEERGLRMKTFYGDFSVRIEEKVYEGPVEGAYEPEKAKILKQLEGVKGTYIGLDVGGSNMKVVTVKDGKLIYSKKYTWDPKKLKPAWRHIRPVKAMIELAVLAPVADSMGINIYSELVKVSSDIVNLETIEDMIVRIRSKLGLRGRKITCKEYIDGIGISWPDIIREQEVVGGRTGKVKHLKRADFEKMIKPLARIIENLFGPRTFLINDGDVGAFVAGVKLGIGNIVSIAMGTSTGIGYLSSNGEIVDYITDMSHVVMYFNETDPETAHETTGIKGAMQKYLSQKGMFRLAEEKGIDLSGIKGETDKLKELQRLYEQSDKRAIEIVETMAIYLADGIQELREGYFSDRAISIFVLSGRIVEGKAGEKIVNRAREILAKRGIGVELKMADELDPNWDDRMRDLAQAVGAVYFAAMNMESYYKDILGNWRNEFMIDEQLYNDAISIMGDKRYGRGAADEIMELVKKRDIDGLKRFVNLKKWREEGMINEELYEGIISLMGDRQYGSFVADKVVKLVKERDINGLKSFVNEVNDKRENVDRIKALLDPTKAYKGYDVIIITSSTQAEADLQGEVLRRIFEGSGRDVKILSVVEEWAEGGAGNFLGTLNAYLEARKQARELYNINLDEYWEGGKRICVIHNGGMGKRDNPFTVSYDNSRGAQNLIGYIKLQDGTKAPITLLTLTILSNCINAISNNGDQIDVYWSSQIIIGNKSTEDVYRDDNKRYLYSTYGMILPADREVTESDLRQFSVWEANDDTEAIVFHKAKTFSSVSEWENWRIEKDRQNQAIFRDIGSHRFSRKLFFYLMDYFDDMLKRKEGKIDLSYDLIQPLMIIIEAFQDVDLAEITSVDDVETKLGKSGRLDDLKRLCTVSPEYYKNIMEIFFANKGEIDSIAKWIKIVDLGDNPYWWTYRTPIDKLNYDLAMIADMVGKKSYIDDNGQIQKEDVTEYDIIMAEDLRRIRRLEYPVEGLEINGRRYSFTLEQVRRGIEVEGVFISGSVVRNCILFPGSRIVNSILEDVIGEVNAEDSELVSVVSPRIDVKRSIIHNLMLADDLIADGRCIAGVYRPEIRDDRYPDGATVINVPIGLDVSADRNFYNVIEDGDNRFSLSALYRFKCDRTENEDLRKGIKIKVFKLMAKKAAAEFRKLYEKLGEDVLPDVTKNITMTDDQIKARRCIEILTRIAMMGDQSIAATALGPLFVDIIEYLNDFLTISARNVCLKVMYQSIDLVRRYPSLKEFDRKMSEFGIDTELEHMAYHNRIRKGTFRDDPSKRNEEKKVVVLPRVTIGAEVAITSVLIRRLPEIYPNAQIIFITGDKKIAQLFGGNPRVRIEILEKERRGGIVANLNSWVRLAGKIKDIDPDFVFAPDSRTDSSGVLPVIEERKYFFWENTLSSDETPRPMAILLNEKMDSVFGKRETGPVPPTVYLQDRFGEFGETLKKNCHLEDRYVVTVKYDVGGVYDKSLGQEFEWEYLKELLNEGNVVIMDRGFGTEELIRSQMLIDKAVEMGVRIVEVTDLPDGRGNQMYKVNLEPDYKGGVLMVFHGTIGGWISMTTIADEAFSYDSVGQHAAAADKGVAGMVPVAGTPVIVGFTGYHSDIFPKMWKPVGRNTVEVMETGIGKCKDWRPIFKKVLERHRMLQLKGILRNHLPLELSTSTIQDFTIPGWPSIEEILQNQDHLSVETMIVLIIPGIVNGLLDGDYHYYRQEIGILYALGYFRQLQVDLQNAVLEKLTNLGYKGLADWFRVNAEKEPEKQIEEISRKLNKLSINTKEIMDIIRLRDQIVTFSRALRIGVEVDELNSVVLEEIVRNKSLQEVLFGLRPAAIIDKTSILVDLEKIKDALWVLRQVEGQAINILGLPDGSLYVYDEYILKEKAISEGMDLGVTRQGLEHLIKLDITRNQGQSIFYQIAQSDIDSLKGELTRKIVENILIEEPDKRFTAWEKERYIYRASELASRVFELERPVVGSMFIGEQDRPTALKNQIEAEIENHRIFNYHIPFIVIDGSQPEFLQENAQVIKSLVQRYGVSIIHIPLGEAVKDIDNIVTNLVQKYQMVLENGKLDRDIRRILINNGILIGGKIDKGNMLRYFFSNPFCDISGLRNYTVLLGKEDRVIMNIDSDAPPETYVLHREERERIRKERRLKREELIIQMLNEASQLLGIQIKSEAEFYKVMANPSNYTKLADLERKYFGYSPDENIGIIPQAMGEIQKLSSQFLKDKYGLGHELGLTHQRYQSLMEPLPDYMVTVSDFEYLGQRFEKDSGRFKVLPVNTIRTARLVGKKVRDTNLPVMKSDLRGTMAVPVVGEERDKMQDKFIFYVPYPFILDQDTSALAQFIRYLEREDKVRKNLQHTALAALITEGVGGFVGDTYVIFNRAALLTTLPTPSIGRDLRLEEPPYVVWVAAPIFEGKVTVAYSPVAGGQQRVIAERQYVISYQDYTELVGGTARRFYEEAVRRFYELLKKTPQLQGEGNEFSRMRALGAEYIKIAEEFILNEKQRDKLIKERDIRGMLTAELGIQRGEKYVEASQEQDSERRSKLEQDVRDMDLIITQYGDDFCFYHTANRKGDNYTPKDVKKDYFYRIVVRGNKLIWEAVYPELTIDRIGGVKYACNSGWHTVEDNGGEIDLGNWRPGDRIQIESGRYIILKRLPGQGIEAIVPAVVEEFTDEFLKRVEKKASDQIKSDGETLILWPDILEFARGWRTFKQLTKTYKKFPGTESVTFEQEQYISGLVEKARTSLKVEIKPIPEDVKSLLSERAPPNWKTQLGVDFEWLIDNDKIRFQIDDLGYLEFYPRYEGDSEGRFCFLEVRDNVALIHLTDATYKKIKSSKISKYLFAQIVIHEFVESFLEMTHGEACEYEERYNSTQVIGVSDLTQYLLNRAAERKNYRYLFGLITQYDIRKDRGGVFLKAVYEAIDKLREEYRDGSYISTGEEFTAWYRYMFEHKLERKDTAVFKITKIINDMKTRNNELERIVDKEDEPKDEWALKYNGMDIKNEKAKMEFQELLKQHDITHIYIPQCPIHLPDEFIVLDIEYGDDVKEEAVERLKRIKDFIDKGSKDFEELKSFGTEFFEVLEMMAVEEHIDLKGLLSDFALKFNSEDDTQKENVISEVAGILYNIPVAKFLAEKFRQRQKDLDRSIGVGAIGSGGAGKSTISTLLKWELTKKGILANVIGADSELYPGGIRYEETSTKGRIPRIWGPGIYNSPRLRRIIKHIKGGGGVKIKTEAYARRGEKTIEPDTKVVILEGVYGGLDPRIAKVLDMQIAIISNESSRILRKIGRDLGVRRGYEDVAFAIRDTVDKLFHEKTDGVKMVAMKHADYVFAEELDGKRRLYIRTDTPISEEKKLFSYYRIPLELRCKVQGKREGYEWGHTRYIQEFLGSSKDIGIPWAELWIGAHDKAPAFVNVNDPWVKGVGRPLNELIRNSPIEILGRDVHGEFGKQLPYLFKVLAAGKPLSIQAHPNKEQARKGYERENTSGIGLDAYNRSYKDQNHKPELICALEDFYALKGFRPLEEIRDRLRDVPEFKNVKNLREFIDDFDNKIESCGYDDNKRKELIKELYILIMNMAPNVNPNEPKTDTEIEEMLKRQEQVDSILQPLIERLRKGLSSGLIGEDGKITNWDEVASVYPKDEPEYWVLRADEEFCNEKHSIYKWYENNKNEGKKQHKNHKDIGIISIYLLNLIHLTPGQALYLEAGELHSYLEGVGLEIMANSDNVLRGGLTPKYVDVKGLLEILTFRSGSPEFVLTGDSGVEKIYETPAREFRLSSMDLDRDKEYQSPIEHSVDSLIVIEGEVEIIIPGKYSNTFTKGNTVFIPASVGMYTIKAVSDKAKVYKASPGIGLLKRHGLIGKEATGNYQELWEAEVKPEVKDGKLSIFGKWKPKKDAGARPDVTPRRFLGRLNEVMERLIEEYGLGILAVVDAIRIVDNIGAEALKEGVDGIVPYAMMTEEDGRNILLLDIDIFLVKELKRKAKEEVKGLLYLVLEHELKESIMTIVPCSNDAIRELTTNYLTLMLALENGIKFDKETFKWLGVDLKFLAALEALDDVIGIGKKITNEQDKRKILVVALEHMRTMPYYADLFEQFPFAVDWQKVMQEVNSTENRYKAALDVFTKVMEAKVDVDKVSKEMVEKVQKELDTVQKEVEINIKVIKTFTGKQRIVGLEGLNSVLQKAIGAVAKAIWGRDYLKERLEEYITRLEVDSTEQYWIVLDKERKEQLEKVIGKDVIEEQIKVLEGLEKNGRQVFHVVDDISIVPKSALSKDKPRVIYLFEFEDWEQKAKQVANANRERMMYLPILYTSSSLYIAAHLLVSGSNIESDIFIENILLNLYSAILGREVGREDLHKLFRMPWEILPEIAKITENIDALRQAIVQIEKAA